MQFDKSKVVLFHGVVDLRKGGSGLIALVDDPQPETWYLLSNRSRSLMKCVRLDCSGLWMGSRRLKQGHYLWVERSRGTSVLSARAAEDLCVGKKPTVEQLLAERTAWEQEREQLLRRDERNSREIVRLTRLIRALRQKLFGTGRGEKVDHAQLEIQLGLAEAQLSSLHGNSDERDDEAIDKLDLVSITMPLNAPCARASSG